MEFCLTERILLASILLDRSTNNYENRSKTSIWHVDGLGTPTLSAGASGADGR
jgi:hypothetical protein